MTSPTGAPETATVSVSVSPDVAPTAVTDSATVGEDTAATAIAVLANDTDPDGGPKVIATASDPVHGTVVLTGGSPGAHTGLTYQPDADFNGTDTFTYTLNGGSTTTVTVTVTPVADIANDNVTVNEDSGTNTLNLLANDTFENPTRAITAVGAATHGTTAINNNGTTGDATDDFVTYTTSQPDFNGTDSFTYTVTSGGVTETATVSVTISAVADVVNDSATTNEDTAVNVLVLGNDTFEGTEAITGTTNGAHGTVAVNNNGTPGISDDDFVVYTPSADFNGTDAFTYTVTSGGVTETGTVSVTISAGADIVGDSVTVAEDSGSQHPEPAGQRHVRERRPLDHRGRRRHARHHRHQQQRHARQHGRRFRHLQHHRAQFLRQRQLHLYGDVERDDRDRYGERHRHARQRRAGRAGLHVHRRQ